jgi:heat shock protein HtpX
MTNSIKAYMLLAVLVALMILAGQVLGGREGMLVALFLSFAMSFVSYWFSDKIVLTMYGAKEADPGSHGDLYRMVDELANRAGIPRPRVFIIPSSSPNAFATGRGPGHSAVAVTEGIMSLLSHDELKGVLAHEIAHVANYDVLLSTIVATLAGALSMLSRMVMWGGLGGRRSNDERGGNPLLALIVMLLAPLVALLVQMAISRSREYLADETGAKLCGEPRWLANALARLQSGVSARPMSDAEPATAHMFIVKPFSGGGFLSLFSTHPPMEERIRRLEAMR